MQNFYWINKCISIRHSPFIYVLIYIHLFAFPQPSQLNNCNSMCHANGPVTRHYKSLANHHPRTQKPDGRNENEVNKTEELRVRSTTINLFQMMSSMKCISHVFHRFLPLSIHASHRPTTNNNIKPQMSTLITHNNITLPTQVGVK